MLIFNSFAFQLLILSVSCNLVNTVAENAVEKNYLNKKHDYATLL